MTDVTSTTPISIIQKDWVWLTQHLVAIVIVVGLALGGVYLVENLIAKHDSATAEKYNTVLTTQAQETKDVETQLQTDEANWTQLITQLTTENNKLAASISTRTTQVNAQVKTDATLSSIDAAARIAQQTKATAGEVVAVGDSITLDLPVSRAITSDLDLLPVVQFNLVDAQTQLKNETQIATDAQADVTEQKKLVTAQQNQLVDAQKSCDARVTAANAVARKSKLQWFLAGVGIVLGGVLGHAL